MASHDGDLRDQVSGLLRGRPGWSLQASSSPGAAPAWCFGRRGEIDLSVDVEEGSIGVYSMAEDTVTRFAGVESLTAWLDAHEAASLYDPLDPGEVVDELVHGKFTKWGHPGE